MLRNLRREEAISSVGVNNGCRNHDLGSRRQYEDQGDRAGLSGAALEVRDLALIALAFREASRSHGLHDLVDLCDEQMTVATLLGLADALGYQLTITSKAKRKLVCRGRKGQTGLRVTSGPSTLRLNLAAPEDCTAELARRFRRPIRLAPG